ncbi:unnamed protein product [Litomosoides sigmodontis]|uniref:MIF4G domain-containing protein n=1 Tax=Litomosoides sigmodontis TaxID=42156 RepID=A0A3P6T1T7_LITSI|nr:unnamed protein product [Litomosoides sigmodontis]
MSDYTHPSYNRTATTNTTSSSHKHNQPSNPASQQQNARPPYNSSLMNSVSSDVYGSTNSQISYQQPSMNSHHNGTFQLNPNAPSFHPAYSYHLHDIPSYANAPMYDGYCPANAYDYQFSQEIPMFTPYMEPPSANGDDAEALGAELGYCNNFGYYGLQANLSPALCERMLCSERAKELQEIQVGLEQLILEPGEFETWSNAIRERTANPSFKIDALKIAVEMIIQLAAFTSSSQTVQYNLAKLCSFLCHDLHTFQDDMIASLLSFHDEQRSYLSDQQRKNLLLFFAEIYEKLESKKSSLMQAFENALLEQIKEVLVADRLDDSKVKVVVEVLKLTGRYLDTDEGTSKINEILTQLNAIAKAHPAISE